MGEQRTELAFQKRPAARPELLNVKLQFLLILLLIRAPPSVTVGAYKLETACSS